MGEWVAATIPSSASLATVINQANSNFSAGKTVVNGSIEGGGVTTPNIASATVDRTRMVNNAKVGVFAAEAGQVAFVVTEAGTKGLQYVSAAALVATYSSGTAWVLQTSTSPDDLVRVTKASTWTVTLTALSDNYVYIKSDASVGVATASVGGSAPTIPADSLLLSVATTDATTVTGTPVDKSPNSSVGPPKHYRSTGCWPAPTSVTNLRLPPGIFEVDGLPVSVTANQDLGVDVSGNFASGVRTSNVWVYYVAANNSGAAKFALTTSTPSAATVIAGSPSGSTGRLQYRKIGGLAYRYLGAHRLVGSGNLLRGSRNNTVFNYASAQALLTAVATPTSYSTIATATRVPPTARTAILGTFLKPPVGDSVTFLRETGTTGIGFRLLTSSSNFASKVTQPLDSSQRFDLKSSAAATMTVDVDGYIEELD